MNEKIPEILGRYSGQLLGFIGRIVGNRDDAMDIAQDIFLRVLSRPGRIADDSRLVPYLFRAAYNSALNSRRDRRRRESKHRELSRVATAETPPQAESVFDRVVLDAALEELSDRQRQALSLRFYADLPIADIAEIMGISVGSVKVHLARGLQNMRRQMSPRAEKESR